MSFSTVSYKFMPLEFLSQQSDLFDTEQPNPWWHHYYCLQSDKINKAPSLRSRLLIAVILTGALVEWKDDKTAVGFIFMSDKMTGLVFFFLNKSLSGKNQTG